VVGEVRRVGDNDIKTQVIVVGDVTATQSESRATRYDTI
jgi:hypothetical protein